jgi:hypothetical protein
MTKMRELNAAELARVEGGYYSLSAGAAMLYLMYRWGVYGRIWRNYIRPRIMPRPRNCVTWYDGETNCY